MFHWKLLRLSDVIQFEDQIKKIIQLPIVMLLASQHR